MNIKSTKMKQFNFNFDWLDNIIDYVPMDKLTFGFSLFFGVFIGFLAVGFGNTAPIFIVIILSVIIGGFGALDGGSDNFLYVLRLGAFTIIMANILVLFPSSRIDYEKMPVVIVFGNVEVKGVKQASVEIFNTVTNERIETKYYNIGQKELVSKLYANTKYIQYKTKYIPLIKYSREMRFYDN